MKISKRVREEAALVMAIGASTSHEPFDVWKTLGLRKGGLVWELTLDAQHEAMARLQGYIWPQIPWHEVYAEAEAMLRTGWGP